MPNDQEQVPPATQNPTPSEHMPPLAHSNHSALILICASISFGFVVLACAYMFIEYKKMTQLPSVSDNIEDTDESSFANEEWLDDVTRPIISEPEYPIDDYKSPTEPFHVLTDDQTDYSGHYSDIVTQDDVVWLPKPIMLGDLGLFTTGDAYDDGRYQYIQIGTYKNEPILYVQIMCEGMCFDSDLMFLYGTKESGYHIITKHSTYSEENNYLRLQFEVPVVNDDTLTFSVFPPKEIDIAGVNFTAGIPTEFFSNSDFNPAFNIHDERLYRSEFISDTPYGPVYRGYREIGDIKTEDLDYALRLPNGLMVYLNNKLAFMTDDRVPQVKWVDGTINTEPYRNDGFSGCGTGGPEVLSTPIDSGDIALAGYTIPDAENMFKIINPKHPLIDRAFGGNTTREYYEYDEATGETTSFQITRTDFINRNGVLIYIDSFGIQHVLTNTKYGPQAECGKPVIYLYPETTTDITVSLDARVTKSEPMYENGWTAIAEPNGTLTVNGTQYESLFWDGYGNGQYPVITEGFVVETEDALPLMAEHLKTMGFNEKETSDFVEFWAPHIPQEPFTRFSWIGTQGMENLAKLYVDPQPDTLIRAFVDYEGLTEKISMPVQEIIPRVRSGYTVTEWGGLLRE